MQLTRYSDYSVRALIYLGLNRHRRCTAQEIADAYGISQSHLMKSIHRLGQKGFIATTRGKNGGLELAMPASQINLGEVFRTTERNFKLAECFAGEKENSCAIAGPCVLTHVLEMALQAFLDVLDRHTLQDLLASANALTAVFEAGEKRDRVEAGSDRRD
ncbi:MAG: Rrf2 family transcriptional regulator [Defluviicoccus sp.]|nr:Rrf2 family transcriptional regulator [Defluviicoccus sp.]MDE0274375.1 Rrf2 family transcriptional regulator [Defluviicoccus sp.]